MANMSPQVAAQVAVKRDMNNDFASRRVPSLTGATAATPAGRQGRG